MLNVMYSPSCVQSVPLNPSGRCSRLYASKNSYDGQLQFMLEMSEKSFCQPLGCIIFKTVEAFTDLWYIVVTERNANVQFGGGQKSSATFFLKEWDNGRSLANCALVRVLIISSTKWEMLKTDKSITISVWSPEVGYTDSP